MGKLFFVGWMLLVLVSRVAAQETMQNGDTPLQPPAQEVPPLPGDEDLDAGKVPPPLDNQTAPEQEAVIPLTDEEHQSGKEAPAIDEEQQPKFNRDVVPRSTEPERESGEVQEDVMPQPGFDGEATAGTNSETPNPDLLPFPPGAEPQPHEDDPEIPPVNPDEVPDRRFETFETEYEGGTPGLRVPEQAPAQEGAAPEKAPL